ncbi:MAG TPA: peroxidase-related enzyme [Acidimicrobiia bacterium]
MADENNSGGAWISIPSSEDLSPVVIDEIGGISEQIGFVPNVARLLGAIPGHFVGWWRYFDDLMRGPSGLTKAQREMIAVVVSAESDCPYCEVAHAAALRLRTKDPVLVERLAVNYRHVDLDPSDRAMLDFAVKLTRTPNECDQEDINCLREAGYSDHDILHIIEVTAIFNYNVRLASATGLYPNPEYHELGRGR